MMTDIGTEDDRNLDILDVLDDDNDDLLEDMVGADLDSSLVEAMAEAAAFLNADEFSDEENSNVVEKTIQTMESTQLCVHPEHSHSFAKVTFGALAASLTKKCAGCHQGFKAASVFGGTSAAEEGDASIVKCMACGVVAHRSCAFNSASTNMTWEPCPVNAPSVNNNDDGVQETTPVVVTDDEQEQEEEYEVALNDNDNQKTTLSRTKSLLSAASDDESMESQDLGEEDGFGIPLGTGEMELQDPTTTEAECSAPTPPEQSPNGVARRAISSLMALSKRKEEGADHNPYVAGDNNDHNNEEGGNNDETAPKNNGTEATASEGDAEEDAAAAEDPPVTPNTVRKRSWFGNSPKKSISKGKVDGEEEEQQPDPEESPNGNRTTRRGWFKRKNGKENQNSDPGDDNDNGATATAEENVVLDAYENNNTEAATTTRMPWLSTLDPGGVEEDYGDDISVVTADNLPSDVEDAAAEDPNEDDANPAGPRGWFQRRQQKDAEEDGVEESTSPAPKLGFGLFSRNRSQKELDDPANSKDDSNSNCVEAMVEENVRNAVQEIAAEAEFSEFLDVEDEEEKKPATAEEARADFNDFLDLSDDVDDENDNEKDKDEDKESQDGREEGETETDATSADEDVADAHVDKKIEDPQEVKDINVDKEKVDDELAAAGEKEGGEAVDDKSHVQDEESQQSKTVEPASEERNGLLGFGLFRRKKVAEHPAEEEAKESGENEAEEVESSDGAAKMESADNSVSEAEESSKEAKAEVADATHAEEQMEDSQEVQQVASLEAENPSTPVDNSKPKFRLFSRRGDDSASKVDASEADPIADEERSNLSEASPRKMGVLMNSLWKKHSNNDDSEGNNVEAEALSKEEGDTSCVEIIEETTETVEKSETQNKPSLLARVFTGRRNKGEEDSEIDAEQTENPDDEERAEEAEEASPRRFSLFGSKKVADAYSKDSQPDDGEKKADIVEEAEKPAPRKFTLFGFIRGGNASPEVPSALRNQSWASDEPPSHWTTATTPTCSPVDGEDGGDKKEGEAEPQSEPLHYANHPFASVSRALQDNIMALLSDSKQKEKDKEEADDERQEDAGSASTPLKPKSSLSLIVSPDSPEPHEHVDMALGEIKAEPVQENTLLKVASGTYEAVKATALAQKKMGMASVAGGIAGGVAGLMFAGPAGAVMGVRYGQTAGTLGVILDGSITVGVIVAGVAGGRFTAEKIQEQIEEHRVLTIGEHGVARKVMLVRPTIRIDPAWHSICAEAQRTSPSSSASSFSMFSGTDSVKQDRYERTSDICEEEEIPTDEKVLLLVSRVLSDKDSFPGHVYRCLMKSFKERCNQRNELRGELAKNKEDFSHLFDGESEDSVNMGGDLKLSLSPRARREDAHGVIKYITGTLLEVRPGLGATPEITETTASVVEALVFGEVYDLVYEEIAIEATEKDKNLIEKIDDFEYARLERTGMPLPTEGIVSNDAIVALRQLPETHAAADKLRFCVIFLENLSDHFAATYDSAMGADSLLKMVCQHIIAARIPCVNAEVAFLEEFAHDEQLLRGKEGYALVTLQAALHFLNMSNDFERDIFGQDNDEENVPIVEPKEGGGEEEGFGQDEEENVPLVEPKAEEDEDATADENASDDPPVEPEASMPPNAEAGADEDRDPPSDLEQASSASSSDEKIDAEIESREEKKDGESSAEENLL